MGHKRQIKRNFEDRVISREKPSLFANHSHHTIVFTEEIDVFLTPMEELEDCLVYFCNRTYTEPTHRLDLANQIVGELGWSRKPRLNNFVLEFEIREVAHG